MSLLYEKINQFQTHSVIARWNKNQHFTMPLHFHDEYELIYIVKSHGYRYVGDSVSPYREGDLVLLGSKLPHTWMNDDVFLNENTGEEVKAVVMQFSLQFYKAIELQQELGAIKRMFDLAQRGLVFSADTVAGVHNRLITIPDIHDTFEKYSSVLSLLYTLSKEDRFKFLASQNYKDENTGENYKRITDTLIYIAEHFNEQIMLDDIASNFNMSTTAFCNYFKRKTGFTFVGYLNSYRTSQACRLLTDTDKTIADIAFLCGFNNLSNFNRIFKSMIKITPKQYRELW